MSFALMTNVLHAQTFVQSQMLKEFVNMKIEILTPKGCLRVALLESKVDIDEKTTDLVWDNFKNIMCRFGYCECDN